MRQNGGHWRSQLMSGIGQELLALHKLPLQPGQHFIEPLRHRPKLRWQRRRLDATVQLLLIDRANDIGGLAQRTQRRPRDMPCHRADQQTPTEANGT